MHELFWTTIFDREKEQTVPARILYIEHFAGFLLTIVASSSTICLDFLRLK